MSPEELRREEFLLCKSRGHELVESNGKEGLLSDLGKIKKIARIEEQVFKAEECRYCKIKILSVTVMTNLPEGV